MVNRVGKLEMQVVQSDEVMRHCDRRMAPMAMALKAVKTRLKNSSLQVVQEECLAMKPLLINGVGALASHSRMKKQSIAACLSKECFESPSQDSQSHL